MEDERDDDAADYDYELPRDLIAARPLPDRAAARLLVLRRATGSILHRRIADLPDLLRPGDLLVVNDTRVVPARLVGRRERTGGGWEGLYLRTETAPPHAGAWVVLAQTRGRPSCGETIVVSGDDDTPTRLLLVGRGPGGTWLARPDGDEPAEAVLGRVGRVPLPGYIRGGVADDQDAERYQTVFARATGSAAAPTAGLHFTADLLTALEQRGVRRAAVTLHVGLDTFRPLGHGRIASHPMHTEWCRCPPETAAAVAATRSGGGRVVAVGTTTVRTLETAAQGGHLAGWEGSTGLFIRPGHRFRAVDVLLTNFHLPRTTLLVLVSTLASRALIRRAYAEAIRERYRFLSYGDAMLID